MLAGNYLQARQPVYKQVACLQTAIIQCTPTVEELSFLLYQKNCLTLSYDVIDINTCTYQDHMSYQECEMIAKFEIAQVHSRLGR